MPDLDLEGVLETCLYVDDLASAELFYGQTLGLAFVSRQEGRHVFFRIGSGMLLIFDPRQSDDANSTLPRHGTSGSGHVAFAMKQRDLPAWESRLSEAGVAIEQIVDWPTGSRSVYFRDPAGNSLELTSPSIWGIQDA
jgi:catechol 2,3-dioxygenase-like lactoylglutathione lyase family enzyme